MIHVELYKWIIYYKSAMNSTCTQFFEVTSQIKMISTCTQFFGNHITDQDAWPKAFLSRFSFPFPDF